MKIGRELSKQLVRRFFIHLLLYSFFIIVSAFLCFRWCKKQVWQPYDSTYIFLNFIEDQIVGVFLFMLLLGCIFISCWHFRYVAKLMEEVTQAVDDLHTERLNYIKLPHVLRDVEQKLNEIMANVKESRNAAKETEARKNEMIVYMAHDLKTPLTSVIGYLTLLKDEKMISEDLKQKYMGIAWNKAVRLEELINEFFEVTRYNYASMALQWNRVNMTRMLEQILYEFKVLFAEKHIVYQLELEPEVYVCCDIEKMERVFDNLLKNAIHYSFENSVLTVGLKIIEQNRMELWIENQGKTIPKEKLEVIFQQFYRMDSSRSTKSGGTGLGLAIAKQIVELHGGKIRCESEKERIRFTLNMNLEQAE